MPFACVTSGDVGSGCEEVTGVGKLQYLVVTGRRPSWEAGGVVRAPLAC
jgi:hypothetical protein